MRSRHNLSHYALISFTRTDPKRHSNIAAVDAQHSDEGLFPIQTARHLLAVLQQEHLGGHTEARVLYENSCTTFETQIVQSSLLSRGWVYQEILLSPANLFCADSQMWWSCAHATYSQTFPMHSIDRVWEDKDPWEFKDGIREMKNDMLVCKEIRPATSWGSILDYYAPTSVSFDGDRLLALNGIVGVFRSLYSDQFQDVEYHSGLWSTDDVLHQLAWEVSRYPIQHHSNGQPGRLGRMEAKYCIPTWSPLKTSMSLRSSQYFRDGEYYSGFTLPNRFVSIDTAHLDTFGRALDLKGCELHLEGVLVNMTILTETFVNERKFSLACPAAREHPESNSDHLWVSVTWDDEEEAAFAALAPANHYRALSISLGCDHNELGDIYGIVLKALHDDEKTSQSPPGVPRWVRVGAFETHVGPTGFDGECEDDQRQRKLVEVEDYYQITQKYGIQLEEDPEADGGRWRPRRLHDPVLEHICIV